MKAIVYKKYGGPEVLHMAEVEKPFPKDDELLVKIFAVSLNDWDWGKLTSESFFDKMMSGFTKPKYQILGSDIAGKVEAIGKDVKKFKIGDEVYGDLSGKWGGFSEYVCANEKALVLKPPGMSFNEAAAIPQAAMLTVQGLIDKGKLQRGQKLLINGAGGGVGTYGVQIAKLYEVDVTVVDSEGKLDMLCSLGADHAIDYTKEDFTKNGQLYDLVLDVKTNRPILNYLKVLNKGGKYITVGGSMSRLLQALLLMPWISLFTSKRVSIVVLKPNKDLDYMNELYIAGKVKPVIDGYFRLEDVPKAFELFSRAEHKGKIVVTVVDEKQ